jgi:GTP-binding protein
MPARCRARADDRAGAGVAPLFSASKAVPGSASAAWMDDEEEEEEEDMGELQYSLLDEDEDEDENDGEGGDEEEEYRGLYVGEEDDDETLDLFARPVEGEEGIDPRVGGSTVDYSKFGPVRPVGSRRKRRPVPVVAVVGRPNVGKSALTNRVARRFWDGSIVHDEAGVTRDRTYRRAEFGGKVFDIVDTGGLVFDDKAEDVFTSHIRDQALIALQEACAVIMVVDGQVGPTALDEEIARFLRQQKLPIALAVNKCESETMGMLQAAEFWSLGMGEPMPVSGLHGTGVFEMLETIRDHIYDVEEREEEEEIGVAIVGRPNVGKSSLLNRLFGEERAIVSDISGTTRDAIDVLLERPGGGRQYRLVDTAGVRKKKKVEYGNEFFMVNRAFKAIRRADVVLLVLDATEGIKDQDRQLAQRIADEGRACVLILNKWDAVEKDEKTYDKTVAYLKEELLDVRWAPAILTSALTGQRTGKIFDVVDEVVENHRKRIRTSVLNEVLRDAILWQAPPGRRGHGGASGKVYYCNQVACQPPTVAVFCNNPKLFSDNYKRYLERKFREQLKFEGSPIRFLWRGKRLRRVLQEHGGKVDAGRGEKARYPKPYAN